MQSARKRLEKGYRKKQGSQQHKLLKMWKCLCDKFVREKMKTKSQNFVFMVCVVGRHGRSSNDIINGKLSASIF